MVKQLKNIIEKVIYMKYQDVQELNFEDMTKEEKAEYKEAYNKVSELQGKLKEMLTKEQWKVINECFDAESYLSAIEQRYIFNRGVKMGLQDLSFIREELGNENILL